MAVLINAASAAASSWWYFLVIVSPSERISLGSSYIRHRFVQDMGQNFIKVTCSIFGRNSSTIRPKMAQAGISVRTLTEKIGTETAVESDHWRWRFRISTLASTRWQVIHKTTPSVQSMAHLWTTRGPTDGRTNGQREGGNQGQGDQSYNLLL